MEVKAGVVRGQVGSLRVAHATTDLFDFGLVRGVCVFVRFHFFFGHFSWANVLSRTQMAECSSILHGKTWRKVTWGTCPEKKDCGAATAEIVPGA